MASEVRQEGEGGTNTLSAIKDLILLGVAIVWLAFWVRVGLGVWNFTAAEGSGADIVSRVMTVLLMFIVVGGPAALYLYKRISER